MGKIRGIFPLFLATAFGVLNGVAIFQPAFADQQKEKLLKEGKDVEVASDAIPEPNEAPTTSLAAKDAPVQSQNKAEQLTKDIKPERSLWSMIGFMGKDVSKAGKEAKGFTDGDPQEAKLGTNR